MKAIDNPFEEALKEAIIEKKEIESYGDKIAESQQEYIKNDEKNIYATPIDEQIKMLNNIKEGLIVSHKKFGIGKITWVSQDKTHIKVEFKEGEKKFISPDAFLQGHLNIV